MKRFSTFASASCLLGIMLLASPVYGQASTLPAVAFASTASASEHAVAPADARLPLRYGMPELRKTLPAIPYPTEAEQLLVEGRVVVEYIVNEKGRVEHPQVVQRLGYGCDDEVLRVLRRARFEPVLDDAGQPQRARYQLAVAFDPSVAVGQPQPASQQLAAVGQPDATHKP